MQEIEKKGKKQKKRSNYGSKLTTAATLILGLGLGITFFFYIPLLLTEWIGVKGGFLFNCVDGSIRLVFFLGYLGLISLWKEIRRIFEYHGAEHKSIYAYESNRPLTLSEVKPFSTHHPRCGTSFLLVVMLVALVVFIMLGKPEDLLDRIIRFLFIPIIGGVSYEIIRLSEKKVGKKFSRILTAPGLWLQRITTKEPNDQQLEVALVALKATLKQKVGKDIEIYSPLKTGH
jgi:uncharacterized protein YqhQ